MKWWTDAAQYATEVLAIVLIFRLLWLRERREQIYVVFVGFLALQLLETVAYFGYNRWGRDSVDYRILWIGSTAIVAVFSLWLVYSLSRAVLTELPGVLRFSRILLNVVFPLAIVIAFSTARAEYWVTQGWKYQDPVDRLMFVLYVADRAICMASVIVLIAILAFILWFPVKMPKNIAIFSVGFVIYFASKTTIELLHSYSVSTAKGTVVLSLLANLVLVLCFLYWIIFLDPMEQNVEVRIGHSWRLAEQNKLLEQLEAINGILLRNSQRLES